MDGYVRSCGRYQNRMMFTIVDLTPHTSIVVTDLSGTVVAATIAMPFGSFRGQREVLSRPPDFLPFFGTLPRFVPYLNVDDARDHDHDQRLAMVDLEQGQVAWVASQTFRLSDE